MTTFVKTLSKKIFIEILASAMYRIIILALVLGVIPIAMRINPAATTDLLEPLSRWWLLINGEISSNTRAFFSGEKTRPMTESTENIQREVKAQVANEMKAIAKQQYELEQRIKTEKLAELKRRDEAELARLAELEHRAQEKEQAILKRQAVAEIERLAELKRQAEEKKLATLKRQAEIEMDKLATIKRGMEAERQMKDKQIMVSSRELQSELSQKNHASHSMNSSSWGDVHIINNHSEKLD